MMSPKPNQCASFDIRPLQQRSENDGSSDQTVLDNASFKFIWIVNGKGNFCIDLETKGIRANQLLFVRPEQFHKFQAGIEMEGYVISFSENFLDFDDQGSDLTHCNYLFKMFSSSSDFIIAEDILTDLKDIIGRMVKELNREGMFRTEILRRYFKIFLLYLVRQFEGAIKTTPQTRSHEIVEKFLSLLDKKYLTQKMVSDYAADLSITPNYLNEIIKKTTGYPAGHHIRQRVVLEAKRQATYSGTCMKEIAYYLGFCDMAHFSKFFKNTTGMNFTEFKKEKLVFSTVLPVMNNAAL
jgi:AraC family transcriptional regulator, transcriptional activator of pobA